MQFHEKLKQLRVKQEYSQDALAQKLHVSRSAVVKWESGNGMPDLANLIAIADVFGVSLDTLLRDERELATSANHFYSEFTIAGGCIGAAIGYLISGRFLLEAIAGCVIGYFSAHLYLLLHKQDGRVLHRILSDQHKKKLKEFWNAHKSDLIYIAAGAGIGGLIGLWLWNKGLL